MVSPPGSFGAAYSALFSPEMMAQHRESPNPYWYLREEDGSCSMCGVGEEKNLPDIFDTRGLTCEPMLCVCVPRPAPSSTTSFAGMISPGNAVTPMSTRSHSQESVTGGAEFRPVFPPALDKGFSSTGSVGSWTGSRSSGRAGEEEGLRPWTDLLVCFSRCP